MSSAPTQEIPPASASRRWLGRILGFAVVSIAMWSITRPSPLLDDPSAPPAGFFDGMKHGAKMPLALPRLLLGHDTTIYAESNTGRTYKLGYTVGVNACGALFFGVMYWRVNRLRKRLAKAR
jgi:hypothetical protein